ncbi:MAG: DUF839 domain-containing protein [Comamonadaceae bacterium]|nr:DUF839 domain-containing protein [Comamonadaceae bacterium]
MVRPSRYARRFTADHALRRRRPGRRPRADAAPRPTPPAAACWARSNNCASGMTPWGTFLVGRGELRRSTSTARTSPTPHQTRWGMRKNGFYRWARARRALRRRAATRTSSNRFGWVVEIDPIDPTSTPVKRTALGRAAHEGAWVAVDAGRPRGGLLRRGRALRVHLQVRQPRPHRARAAPKANRRAAGPRHAVRGALRRRRHAAAGCRWCTARGR